MAHSETYERFLQSVLSPTGRSFMDQVDLVALHALEPTEWAEAEQLLIDRLAGGSDFRAPKALVEMDSIRAVPALRKALRRMGESARAGDDQRRAVLGHA